jgi:hypothetical protein
MNPQPAISIRTSRIAAAAIASMAVLVMVALFHHPVIQPDVTARGAQLQIARLSAENNLVHGALTAMLCVLASALAVFGHALGPRRPALSAALAVYCLGCVLLGVAMLFDGFIVPRLAGQFASGSTSETEAGLLILHATGIVIQVFSKAGLIAHCVAILTWSYAAATSGRPSPGLLSFAAIGVPAALLPAALIMFTDLRLAPRSLMAVFAIYVVWYLAAAWRLYGWSKTEEEVRTRLVA